MKSIILRSYGGRAGRITILAAAISSAAAAGLTACGGSSGTVKTHPPVANFRFLTKLSGSQLCGLLTNAQANQIAGSQAPVQAQAANISETVTTTRTSQTITYGKGNVNGCVWTSTAAGYPTSVLLIWITPVWQKRHQLDVAAGFSSITVDGLMADESLHHGFGLNVAQGKPSDPGVEYWGPSPKPR